MNTKSSYQYKLRLSPARLVCMLGSFAALALLSSAQSTESPKNKDVIEVEVHATPDQAGKFTLDREQVNIMPSTTGTIEEALRTRSAVQFDLHSRNSELGGEITPPRFSIKGGNFYDNNFLVDGVSNNNLFDQSGANDSNPTVTSDPAGQAQSFFINPDLIGSVAVYTGNVPVEYGGFTGGVFDAKIRDPRTDGFHGSLIFRNYTRDSWTSQKYFENIDPALTTDTNTHQPIFEKYAFSASVESPLFKNVTGLINYSEIRSNVAVWNTLTPADKFTNHTINQNLLVKLSTYALNDFRASLTTTYAPYEREWRFPSRKDSLYRTDGGGISAVFDTNKEFSFATFDGNISYRSSELSRDASTNEMFAWTNKATNTYANWGGTSTTAAEGSLGDYEQHQESFGAKASMTFVTFGPKYFRNTIKIGGEWNTNEIKRDAQDAISYSWNKANHPGGAANGLNTNAVGEKENGIITGEQWLNTRLVYGPTYRSLRQTDTSAYLEDTIKIERFTARPGVRMDHETYLGTTTWSPRIFLSADVLNNGVFNIFGGAAQYSKSPVSSFKYVLYNNHTRITQTRTNYDAPWVNSTTTTTLPYGMGNLKSPYADEFNIGASTTWKGYIFRLDGSIRQHRDVIRTKNGQPNFTRTYSNTGKSDYSGITFEIEKEMINLGWAGKHSLLMSLTHSKTESNSREDYTMEENDGGNFTYFYVMYNGELTPADNLSATNFSSPLVVVLSDMARFWDGRVRLYNTLRFEKGGDGLVRTTKDPNKLPSDPDYNKYYVLNDGMDPGKGGAYMTSMPTNQFRTVYYFTDRKYENFFFWDISLDFDVIKTRAGTVSLQFQVTNVLDYHKIVNTSLSASGGTYTSGRQLYGGIQYKF